MKIVSLNASIGFNGNPNQYSVVVAGHESTDGVGQHMSFSIGSFSIHGKAISIMNTTSTGGQFTEYTLEDDIDKYKKDVVFTTGSYGEAHIIDFGNNKDVEENGAKLSDLQGKIPELRHVSTDNHAMRWRFNGETVLEVLQRVCTDLGYEFYFSNGFFQARHALNYDISITPPEGTVISKKEGVAVSSLPASASSNIINDENYGPWALTWPEYSSTSAYIIGGYEEKMKSYTARMIYNKIRRPPSVYVEPKHLSAALRGYDAWVCSRGCVYMKNEVDGNGVNKYDEYLRKNSSINKSNFSYTAALASSYYGKNYVITIPESDEYEIVGSAYSTSAPNEVCTIGGDGVKRASAWAKISYIGGIETLYPYASKTTKGPPSEKITNIYTENVKVSLASMAGQIIDGYSYGKNEYVVSFPKMPYDGILPGVQLNYIWEGGGTWLTTPWVIPRAQESVTVYVPMKSKKKRYIKPGSKSEFTPYTEGKKEVAEYIVAGFPKNINLGRGGLTSITVNVTVDGGYITRYSYETSRTSVSNQTPRKSLTAIKHAVKDTYIQKKPVTTLEYRREPTDIISGDTDSEYTPFGGFSSDTDTLRGYFYSSCEKENPPGWNRTGMPVVFNNERGHMYIVIPKGVQLFIQPETESYIDYKTGALHSKYR